MTNDSTNKEPRFTGRHMLFVMMAFFGVIFIANGCMVYFSSHSWTGLVVKNGYVASQAFNKEVEAQEALNRAGWRGELTIKDGQFGFVLSKIASPVDGCTVSGFLKRPVHDKADQTLAFESAGAGLYQAKTGRALAPGLWNLEMKANCPTERADFQQNYRFRISAS